jgi:hypothetical protein
VSRAVTVHAEAELELQETALWYEARQAGLGGEFLEAVDGVIQHIAGGFDGAPCARSDRTIRCASMPRFPHRVVFVIEGMSVIVLAFAHHRRRPGYWRSRR